ncbi:hypothetical protein SH449x_003800 [Pirellulaceae bacterium SH449]
MSRAQETTRARIANVDATGVWGSRWSTARNAFASSIALGLSIASTPLFAQQAPAWSPQPYVRPASAPEHQSSIRELPEVPKNSLRSGAQTEPATALRWGKADGSSAARSANYSDSFGAEIHQSSAGIDARDGHSNQDIEQQTPQVTRTKVVRRESAAAQAEMTLMPSTGWSNGPTPNSTSTGEMASVQRTARSAAPNSLTDLAVQDAPMAEPPRMKNWPSQTKSADIVRAVSSNNSTRREWKQVQPASYQDDSPPSSLPSPTFGLPRQGDPSSESMPPSLVLPPSNPMRGDDRSPSDSLGRDDWAIDPGTQMTNRPPRAQRVSVDCDTLQKSIEAADIRTINVDSSPKFVEGYRGNRGTNSKDEFARTAPMREWYGNDGELIAFGKLVDYVRGQVVIETADGDQLAYLFNRLSNVDLAYVADVWGLPVVCALNDGTLEPRQFVPTTMTFKASGSCHKPLYFEEPQLERYGHEWGPVVQPVISTANFVKNVAILPYKMGIHPMNECQYPVGYYRPGECAPWTVGPVPISLRGALFQAGAITGASAILP